MKIVEQRPAMKPITGYTPGRDWSPGVPEHLVDELTGKPAGTVPPKHPGPGYPTAWTKKEPR